MRQPERAVLDVDEMDIKLMKVGPDMGHRLGSSGLVKSKPDDDGYRDAYAGKEGIVASVVSGVNPPPVPEFAETASALFSTRKRRPIMSLVIGGLFIRLYLNNPT